MQCITDINWKGVSIIELHEITPVKQKYHDARSRKYLFQLAGVVDKHRSLYFESARN